MVDAEFIFWLTCTIYFRIKLAWVDVSIISVLCRLYFIAVPFVYQNL